MKELYIPVKTEDEKNANPLPKKAADAKMTRAEMIAKRKKNAKTNAKNNAQKK